MKDFLFSKLQHFRYERKFYLEGIPPEDVEAMLRLHPAIFRQIYYPRRVNNIYFDSFNLQHYFDNLNGIDRRLKVRIRWYGELFGPIENPVLELKLKHNLHIGKLQYPLKPFTLDKGFSTGVIRTVFKDSALEPLLELRLKELKPSLINSYRRKYFLSADGIYRITIDMQMQACKIDDYQNTFLARTSDCNTILELKYGHPADASADEITGYFPFRMTRSSKYVEAMERIRL